MGRNNAALFVILGLCALGFILYLILSLSSGNFWGERLNMNNDEPYDLELFKELLDSAVDGENDELYQSLDNLKEDTTPKTLVFMNHFFYADSLEAQSLVEFVARGNTAFIVANQVSDYLLESLYIDENIGDTEFYYDTFIEAEFANQELGKKYRFEFRDGYGETLRYWSYFEDSLSQNTRVERLGFFNDDSTTYKMDNFRRVQIGKGQLLVHTEPLLFCNLYLIEQDGFEYVDGVIGYLPNQPIVWDYYHGVYHPPEQHTVTKSPLRFVMQHPPLKYAWFTLLGAALLFVVFRSKRQQKIIPLTPRIENTSIAFAQSLGALFYQADSGRYLAIEQMKLFNNFNRRRFGIRRKKDNDGLAVEIAKKSKVPVDLIEKILSLERQIVFNPTSKMKDNIALYHMLNEYYKRVKK